MRRHFASIAFLAAACGGAAACASAGAGGGTTSSITSNPGGAGSDTTSGSTTAPDAGPLNHDALTTAVGAYCSQYAGWYCTTAIACGCKGTPDWPGSKGSCEKVVLDGCLPMVETIEDQGLTFLPDRASACIAALQGAGNAACIGTPNAFEACPEAIAKPVGLGDDCEVDTECAGGQGHCVEKTCKAHAPVGESCAHAACAPGTFCSASQVCRPIGGPGAACDDSSPCGLGLVCDGGGLCAAPVSAGLSCTANDVCQAGTVCKDGTCQPAPTSCHDLDECGPMSVNACAHPWGNACVPLLPNGATCKYSFQCASGSCDPDTWAESGVCAPAPGSGDFCDGPICAAGLGCSMSKHTCQPPAGVDDACNEGPPELQCAAGSVCSGATYPPHCVAVPGPSCGSDADCASGLRCSVARVCRTPVGLGDHCDPATPCAAGLSCSSGNCRAPVGLGAVCPDDFTVCEPGLACVSGPNPGHGTCQVPSGDGQPCTIDGVCAEGLGCLGVSTLGVCQADVCFGSVWW